MAGQTSEGLPTYGGRVHEYFRGLKTGPLVDQDLIERALSDIGHAIPRPTLEDYARILSLRIGHFGDESTAHLCLPSRPSNALARAGIHRIDQIRDLADSGKITGVRTFGEVGLKEVSIALADFDRLAKLSTLRQV